MTDTTASLTNPENTTETSWPKPSPMSGTVLLAVAVVTAVVRVGPEFLETYIPGCDEAHMLQAAVRLARGQGLTGTWHNPVEDLAEPTYVHNYCWPPIYSWTVAGLLWLGVGYQVIMDGLKLLKLLGVLAGVLGWLQLSNRCLPPGWVWLYGLAVPGMLYVEEHCAEYGPNHLFGWGMLPWLVLRLQAALEKSVATEGASPWRDWLKIACWGMGLIGVRYVVHLPAAAAATVLLCSGGAWWRRLAGSALVCAPAAGVFFAFRAYNVSSGAPGGWLEGCAPGYDWSAVDLTQPLRALTLYGLGLSDAVRGLSPSLLARVPEWCWRGWELFVFTVGMWGLVTWYRSGSHDPQRPRVAGLMAYTLSAWTCLTVMLCVMSARVAVAVNTRDSWLPLQETRYFSEVIPLVGLLGVVGLAELTRRFWPIVHTGSALSTAAPATTSTTASVKVLPAPTRSTVIKAIAVASVVTVALVVGVTESRMLFRGIRSSVRPIRSAMAVGIRIDPPLEQLIREASAELTARTGEPVRVFDVWGRVGIARWNRDDSCGAHRCDAEEELSRSGCSRPVWVFVVVRWNTNRQRTEAKWEWQTALARGIVDWLGFVPDAQAWRTLWDQGYCCQVFRCRVEPYPPGARGRPRVPLGDAYPKPILPAQ